MDSRIVESYSDIFKTYADFQGGILEAHVKKLVELDTFIPHSSTFFCVTNTTSRSFEYVSKNFIQCLGLDIQTMLKEGMTFWWSRMHPDEMQHWLQSLQELMVFTMSEFAMDERRRMSYTWNYRIRNGKDQYVNIIQHTTPMYFDDAGKPVIGLAHYSVLPGEFIMPIQATAKILNKKQEYETIYYQIYGEQKKLLADNISHRERDILRLLSFGYANDEIGDKLNISENTVKTHRRNILNKSDCRNTTELVAKCIREGII